MKKVMFLILATTLILCGCAGGKAEKPRECVDVDEFGTSLSANEALEKLKSDGGVVVFENLKAVSGKELWEYFCKEAEEGRPVRVTTAKYYDADYASEGVPVLFLSDVSFDGKTYTVRTRDVTSAEYEREAGPYEYMKHFTGDMPEGATAKTYEEYILTHDEALTYEDIQRSFYSSSSGDWLDTCSVFTDYRD